MEDAKKVSVDSYRRVLELAFARLSPAMGQSTIEDLLESAVAQQPKRHSILAYISVTKNGIDWDPLYDHLHTVSLEQLRAAMDDLLDDFFKALSEFIARMSRSA